MKKYWERYREKIISLSIIVPFSYDNPSREVKNSILLIRLRYLYSKLLGQQIKTNIRIIIHKNRTPLGRLKLLRNNTKISKGSADLDFHL
jgi:hypothetical protein